jgi:hypothetical protein
MLKRFTAILITAVILMAAPKASAQDAPYKFDFGVELGMSGYIGDANQSSILKHPGFDGEVSFRYLPNTRWAFRGVLSTFNLSGDTSEMENVLPNGEEFSFKSQVYDLGARVEFNFFGYGIGETYKRLRRWTPYLTLGVGVCMSSCDGSTAFAPNIPMGAGLKFKLKERLNLSVEFTMTKAFGDHVDGPELSDLTHIKSSFLKNNDWYSRFTVGLSFEFGKRCETCHYVD